MTTKPPRIAFGSWAFAFGPFADDPWSFDEVCRYAADAGYAGVEINGFRPHPHHRDFTDHASCVELGRMMDEAGVVPVAYAPDLTTASPAEVPTATYLAEIDAACAFCERMGIPLMRVDTVSPPDVLPAEDFARRFDHLVTTWQAAARRCAASGVTLAWEFEPGFWLNRPSDVVRLVDAVGDPAFGVLFDSSHAYMGAVVGAKQGPEPEVLLGGDVEYARLLEPYVRHLHLIDSDGSLHDDETSAHLPFGAGKIDFPAVLAALQPTVDRLEWWGVDFCFCPTTEADARTAVPFIESLARTPEEAA